MDKKKIYEYAKRLFPEKKLNNHETFMDYLSKDEMEMLHDKLLSSDDSIPFEFNDWYKEISTKKKDISISPSQDGVSPSSVTKPKPQIRPDSRLAFSKGQDDLMGDLKQSLESPVAPLPAQPEVAPSEEFGSPRELGMKQGIEMGLKKPSLSLKGGGLSGVSDAGVGLDIHRQKPPIGHVNKPRPEIEPQSKKLQGQLSFMNEALEETKPEYMPQKASVPMSRSVYSPIVKPSEEMAKVTKKLKDATEQYNTELQKRLNVISTDEKMGLSEANRRMADIYKKQINNAYRGKSILERELDQTTDDVEIKEINEKIEKLNKSIENDKHHRAVLMGVDPLRLKAINDLEQRYKSWDVKWGIPKTVTRGLRGMFAPTMDLPDNDTFKIELRKAKKEFFDDYRQKDLDLATIAWTLDMHVIGFEAEITDFYAGRGEEAKFVEDFNNLADTYNAAIKSGAISEENYSEVAKLNPKKMYSKLQYYADHAYQNSIPMMLEDKEKEEYVGYYHAAKYTYNMMQLAMFDKDGKKQKAVEYISNIQEKSIMPRIETFNRIQEELSKINDKVLEDKEFISLRTRVENIIKEHNKLTSRLADIDTKIEEATVSGNTDVLKKLQAEVILIAQENDKLAQAYGTAEAELQSYINTNPLMQGYNKNIEAANELKKQIDKSSDDISQYMKANGISDRDLELTHMYTSSLYESYINYMRTDYAEANAAYQLMTQGISKGINIANIFANRMWNLTMNLFLAIPAAAAYGQKIFTGDTYTYWEHAYEGGKELLKGTYELSERPPAPLYTDEGKINSYRVTELVAENLPNMLIFMGGLNALRAGTTAAKTMMAGSEAMKGNIVQQSVKTWANGASDIIKLSFPMYYPDMVEQAKAEGYEGAGIFYEALINTGIEALSETIFDEAKFINELKLINPKRIIRKTASGKHGFRNIMQNISTYGGQIAEGTIQENIEEFVPVYADYVRKGILPSSEEIIEQIIAVSATTPIFGVVGVMSVSKEVRRMSNFYAVRHIAAIEGDILRLAKNPAEAQKRIDQLKAVHALMLGVENLNLSEKQQVAISNKLLDIENFKQELKDENLDNIVKVMLESSIIKATKDIELYINDESIIDKQIDKANEEATQIDQERAAAIKETLTETKEAEETKTEKAEVEEVKEEETEAAEVKTEEVEEGKETEITEIKTEDTEVAETKTEETEVIEAKVEQAPKQEPKKQTKKAKAKKPVQEVKQETETKTKETPEVKDTQEAKAVTNEDGSITYEGMTFKMAEPETKKTAQKKETKKETIKKETKKKAAPKAGNIVEEGGKKYHISKDKQGNVIKKEISKKAQVKTSAEIAKLKKEADRAKGKKSAGDEVSITDAIKTLEDKIATTKSQQEIAKIDAEIKRLERERKRGVKKVKKADVSENIKVREPQKAPHETTDAEAKEYNEKRKTEPKRKTKERLLSQLPAKVSDALLKAIYGENADGIINRYAKQRGDAMRNLKHTNEEKKASLAKINRQAWENIVKDYLDGKLSKEAMTAVDKYHDTMRQEGRITKGKGEQFQVTEQIQAKGEGEKNVKTGKKHTAKDQKGLIKIYQDVFGMSEKKANTAAALADVVIEMLAKRMKTTKEKAYKMFHYVSQEGGKYQRSSVEILQDGTILMKALTDPNVSSPIHELAHIYALYLTQAEKNIIARWAGEEIFNNAAEEMFARGLIKYLQEGVAPDVANKTLKAKLDSIFNSFKSWLTSLFGALVGSETDVRLTDEMRDLYASLFGANVEKVIGEQKTGKRQKPFNIEGKVKVLHAAAKKLLGNKQEHKELLEAFERLGTTAVYTYNRSNIKNAKEGAKNIANIYIEAKLVHELVRELKEEHIEAVHSIYIIDYLLGYYNNKIEEAKKNNENTNQLYEAIAELTAIYFDVVAFSAGQTLQATQMITKRLFNIDPAIIMEHAAKQKLIGLTIEALMDKYKIDDVDFKKISNFLDRIFAKIGAENLKRWLNGEIDMIFEDFADAAIEQRITQILSGFEGSLAERLGKILNIVRGDLIPIHDLKSLELLRDLKEEFGIEDFDQVIPFIKNLVETLDVVGGKEIIATKELQSIFKALGVNNLKDALAEIDKMQEMYKSKEFEDNTETLQSIRKILKVDENGDIIGKLKVILDKALSKNIDEVLTKKEQKQLKDIFVILGVTDIDGLKTKIQELQKTQKDIENLEKIKEEFGVTRIWDIKDTIDDLKKKVKELQKTVRELKAQKEELEGTTDQQALANIREVEPLLKMLKKMFPNMTTAEAVKELKKKLKELEEYKDKLGMESSDLVLSDEMANLLKGKTKKQQDEIVRRLTNGQPLNIRIRTSKGKKTSASKVFNHGGEMLGSIAKLSRSQQRYILEKYLDQFIKAGFVDDLNFQNIMAGLMGVPAFTEKHKNVINNIVTLNSAYENAVREYGKEMTTNNKMIMLRLKNAQVMAEKKLSQMMAKTPATRTIIKYNIQGKLLVYLISFQRNVYANFLRPILSVPAHIGATSVDLLNTALARALKVEELTDEKAFNRALKKILKKQRTIDSLSLIEGFIKNFPYGTLYTLRMVFSKYGVNSNEVGKLEINETFPINRSIDKTLGRVWNWMLNTLPQMPVIESDERYSERENMLTQKYSEKASFKDWYITIVSPMAELSFRFLALGDMPFRIGYRKAMLRNLADKFGLDKKDIKLIDDTNGDILKIWETDAYKELTEEEQKTLDKIKELKNALDKVEVGSSEYVNISNEIRQLSVGISETLENMETFEKLEQIVTSLKDMFNLDEKDVSLVRANIADFVIGIADEYGAEATYQTDAYLGGHAKGIKELKTGQKRGNAQGALVKSMINKAVSGVVSGINSTPVRTSIETSIDVLLTSALPYEKTLFNILLETFKYGAPTTSLMYAAYHNATGNKADASRYYGIAMSGFIFRVLSFRLAELGVISGVGEDKDRKMYALSTTGLGMSPNGINISALSRYFMSILGIKPDEKWYEYRDADEIKSLPLMGTPGVLASAYATYYTSKQRRGEMVNMFLLPDISNIGSPNSGIFAYPAAIAKGVIQTSFLQSVNQMINVFMGTSDEREVKSFAAQLATTLVSTGIDPLGTVVRRHRSVYEKEHKTRVDRDKNYVWKSLLHAYGIPTENEEFVVDVFGNKVRNVDINKSKFKHTYLTAYPSQSKKADPNAIGQTTIMTADGYLRKVNVYVDRTKEMWADMFWEFAKSYPEKRTPINVHGLVLNNKHKPVDGGALNANRIVPSSLTGYVTVTMAIFTRDVNGDEVTVEKSTKVKVKGEKMDEIRMLVGKRFERELPGAMLNAKYLYEGKRSKITNAEDELMTKYIQGVGVDELTEIAAKNNIKEERQEVLWIMSTALTKEDRKLINAGERTFREMSPYVNEQDVLDNINLQIMFNMEQMIQNSKKDEIEKWMEQGDNAKILKDMAMEQYLEKEKRDRKAQAVARKSYLKGKATTSFDRGSYIFSKILKVDFETTREANIKDDKQ